MVKVGLRIDHDINRVNTSKKLNKRQQSKLP